MKRFSKIIVLTLAFFLISFSVSAQGAQESEEDGKVVIEFMQWWQPEMAEGSFNQMINEFEAENPSIEVKIVSLPYSEVRDQLMIQAAGATLPDVVGVDPQWIRTLIKYGVIENLDPYIEKDNLDISNLAMKKADNSAWIFPVTSYTYPLFYNIDYLEDAGLSGPPETREEFVNYAAALTDSKKGHYGWVVPLDLSLPNGVSNDIAPWVWSAGYDIMKNGKPYLNNKGVIDALSFVNNLYQKGYLSPGAMSKKEPEKVEEFANGRVAMMISSIAHINILRERNPDLNFGIASVPGPQGYNGPSASRVASWDVGISASSSEKEKEAAWKLVKYLSSKEVNSFIASNANAFPGNLKSEPDFVTGDPLYEKAFEIFASADLYYPLVGAPDAVELERIFVENIHKMLEGDITPSEVAKTTNDEWDQIFSEN